MTDDFDRDATGGKPDKPNQEGALTHAQRRRVLAIIEELGPDLAVSLQVMEQGLSSAIRASKAEFDYWEEHRDEAGFVDEFTIDDPAVLPAHMRFALVARLVRSVAMAFGVGTDDDLGEIDPDPTCVGTPVRELLAIVSGTASEAQETT